MSSWVSCQSLWPHSHLSGHQDIKKSFCFLEESVVPWHWCSYSKSYNPYLREKISQFVIWSSWWKIFSQLWEVDVSFFWLVDCQNFVYIPQKFSESLFLPALCISRFLEVIEEIIVLGITFTFYKDIEEIYRKMITISTYQETPQWWTSLPWCRIWRTLTKKVGCRRH